MQDKTLNPDGILDERDDEGSGLLGGTVTVNGIGGAWAPVATERIRLRILNGSTMRVYSFGLDGKSEFEMVGSDGGLLTAPVRLRRLAPTPGGRAEIVVCPQTGQPRARAPSRPARPVGRTAAKPSAPRRARKSRFCSSSPGRSCTPAWQHPWRWPRCRRPTRPQR
ncbi:hypothetical protein AB0442_34775 [Kitasatospora sp. NPDC085895]|uniref:hypothetical protein n=1 Tax=Kitasatospora sp. NPDC085895 TaxID=3155057 RepID=UPI00344E72C0